MLQLGNRCYTDKGEGLYGPPAGKNMADMQLMHVAVQLAPPPSKWCACICGRCILKVTDYNVCQSTITLTEIWSTGLI